MQEFFVNIDIALFKVINQTCSNPLFDQILPWFRDRFFWLPLYVFLAVLVVFEFRRKSYIILLSAILVVLICDQLSSSFMKPTFQRQRPCNLELLENDVRVLAPCRNSFSFTSSHATNHFGVATFFALLFLPIYKRKSFVLFFWAFMVSISQVYVGLHFPFDILIGGLIGVGVGKLIHTLLSKYYLNFEKRNSVN